LLTPVCVLLTITSHSLTVHSQAMTKMLSLYNQLRNQKPANMKQFIKFGEDVEGYSIPVLNEREIRAAAGILFLGTFISLVFILAKGNFIPVKYFITFFLTDLVMRVFINPRLSPSLIIGRLIVRNQVPEYVGAHQKRFAWIIGIILALTMFILLVIVNAYSPITGIICLICLIFLFFESAFGICLGCKVYPLFFRGRVKYCPGEVCDRKSRQDIQKTSLLQLFVVATFIVLIFLTVTFTKDYYSRKPYDLFGISTPR